MSSRKRWHGARRRLQRRLAVAGSVVVVTVLSLLEAGDTAVSAQGGVEPTPRAVDAVEVFYRSPVLVPAGTRVEIPVDVVCVRRGGSACEAAARLKARAQDGPWTAALAPASPGLTFDLTQPAARAVSGPNRASGAVSFRISALSGPGESVGLPGGGRSLRLFVARDVAAIPVPPSSATRRRRGTTVLFLPWGDRPSTAGILRGQESITVGPSSFDVDAHHRIHLVDPVRGRVGIYGEGRLLSETGIAVPARTDIAVTPSGRAYLASSSRRSERIAIRALDRSGHRLPGRVSLPGLLSELRVSGSRPFVRTLPLDAWVPAGVGGSPGRSDIYVGRPYPSGERMLAAVSGNVVRLGLVGGGVVRSPVELRPAFRMGELSLAEPVEGGYVAVLHVAAGSGADRERYEVVRVGPRRLLAAFTVAGGDLTATMPLSRFRLGKDGALYEMRSSPAGLRIVRYGLGEGR